MPRADTSPPLRLVQDGAPEPLTLETAYRDYARWVAHLALRVLGRDHEVDDIVQDVFVAAASGLKRLRDPRAAHAWLGTVTLRLALRRLRARRVLALVGLDPQPDYGALCSRDASPEQRAQISQLYRALDRLPAQERIAWTLRHVEAERLEEVATLCRCSLATAKRRIAAAEDRLREELSR